MPDFGAWVTGTGFADRKWNMDEFFEEVQRLSGIPRKDKDDGLDWGRLNAMASVLIEMGKDLKRLVETRDASAVGFLARRAQEFAESLVKEVGPYLAPVDVDPNRKLMDNDPLHPDWREMRMAAEMIRALANTLTEVVGDKNLRGTKTEIESLRQRVNDMWRMTRLYED